MEAFRLTVFALLLPFVLIGIIARLLFTIWLAVDTGWRFAEEFIIDMYFGVADE